MKLKEGLNYPVIVVDVQPAYDNPINYKIMEFVNKQTGPVLMYINADDTGLTDDTKGTVKQYWEEHLSSFDNHDDDEEYYSDAVDWSRFQIIDKGYGYLRSWMDSGISESTIIATIREMYAQQVYDSRDLEFPSDKLTSTETNIIDAIEEMDGDNISVNWVSIKQLRKFNGAYIVGGGRNECLREVELMMNAFNIKYKRINSLVY